MGKYLGIAWAIGWLQVFLIKTLDIKSPSLIGVDNPSRRNWRASVGWDGTIHWRH